MRLTLSSLHFALTPRPLRMTKEVGMEDLSPPDYTARRSTGGLIIESQ